jgi:hypothetical protein
MIGTLRDNKFTITSLRSEINKWKLVPALEKRVQPHPLRVASTLENGKKSREIFERRRCSSRLIKILDIFRSKFFFFKKKKNKAWSKIYDII